MNTPPFLIKLKQNNRFGIFPIGASVIGCTPYRQRVGDLLSKTYVVREYHLQ